MDFRGTHLILELWRYADLAGLIPPWKPDSFRLADLAAMIRNNQFREDLFYRLNVFPIEIPPLRERPGDIPLLVHYFVSRLARKMQKKIETIPKRAMEALMSASWPGNVRELENVIERAVILTQGNELNVPVAELKNTMRAPRTTSASTFHDAERQAIVDALKAASGRIAGAGGAHSSAIPQLEGSGSALWRWGGGGGA